MLTLTVKKILIIEDDDILLSMYTKMLNKRGFEVLQAKNGKTAINLAQIKNPHLILLDIMLPGGLNGFDVLEQLKSNEKTKNIKVLILTNLDSEKKVAKEIGATDYLVKVDNNPASIVEKINELLLV